MPRKWILFNYNNKSPKTVPHLSREATHFAIKLSRWDTLQIAQQAYHYTFIYQ